MKQVKMETDEGCGKARVKRQAFTLRGARMLSQNMFPHQHVFPLTTAILRAFMNNRSDSIKTWLRSNPTGCFFSSCSLELSFDHSIRKEIVN